ncbi:5'/3'-nucleotidase SurE [Ammoniphilus sp. CFH 90114]|uniref:5'/3'-nucleotidase SurE n=1 Tax=Ammoniphilus sp. CFH 90114 TaxID=2493665 RepID=UPI00100FD804|nr:5'/3'-nucleotidase SurE [Ammoniphilus sp. CFH 90114]RXT04350.1 5'/3'-nucleotidase SurE [Ammoniphilus sp. CFH 90114]
MKILVTNDDGIFAPGVEAMVEVLQHFGEVYVVCPDQERSAISHSITLRQPLKATPVDLFGSNVSAWAVNGTPVDCTKLGLEVLVKDADIVFSGINIGPNLGRDVFYSGTMAAASEAALYQKAAAAISLDAFHSTKINFGAVKSLFYEVAENILSNKIPKGVFLNVNLPHLSKELCKGVRMVSLDMDVSRYRFVGLNDPHGQVYHWLRDELPQLGGFQEDGDYQKLKEGYITIAPIELKWANSKKQQQIERWFRYSSLHYSKEELSNA